MKSLTLLKCLKVNAISYVFIVYALLFMYGVQ